ncbi:ABC transporter substrate-binding protein [Desulfosarcina ovata subsp. sediminis]|uniref:ABC transporter substrate-binding protein n=1 Tax=Desulfosarcina ovata subsp. sediminis TaxID=885957 RepID=A0A5K8A1G0_9BACT|nr:ABC transporter substrate-binding protein [Desulfosarcina ovata]BBO86198.1 ABC transporter substrate-binding protein [Desulfosarcina ovata subsp. sediminis]
MGSGLLFLLMMAISGHVYGEVPVVIGVATSLTTLEGRDSLLAARLAVEEINQGGGVAVGKRRVRLKIEAVDLKDAQADVKVQDAVARLESFLATSRATAVVAGPFRSEVLLPAMDVIARRQIPMISTIAMTPAMESKIMRQPDTYRTIFRTGLNTRYLADGLIAAMRFLNQQYGFRRVFIISQDAAWARSTVSLMLKLYFKPTGWQILATRHYPYETDDFSAALAEAACQDAQVILSIFDTPHSGQLVVQWKARQSPGLLCGFISPMMGPGAWKRFNGRIGGVLNMIFELGNIPSQTVAPASRFYEAFNTRYHREIEAGHGPAPTYESIYLLAQAITATGSLDAKRIAAALEGADRMGAMGRLRFNIGHQVIFGTDPEEAAVACLIQWNERGQRVIVYPPSLAESEILLPPSPVP